MAKKKKTAAGETLRIQQVRSLIGSRPSHRQTVRGLGLRRMHQIVERADTPQVRGMIATVPHLVAIVEPKGE
jgi:large subunit ribosomal protein L30